MAEAGQATHTQSRKSCSKRICNEVAYALVLYTMLLIFVTSPAIHFGDMSIFPYFLLVVLVALAIPFLRGLERKWHAIEASGEVSRETSFTADRIKLWAFAILMPIIFMGIARVLSTGS